MFSNINLALSKGFTVKDKVTLTRNDAEVVYHANHKKTPFTVTSRKFDKRGNTVAIVSNSYPTLYSALRSVI